MNEAFCTMQKRRERGLHTFPIYLIFIEEREKIGIIKVSLEEFCVRKYYPSYL
jgi:hypothetical protein